MRRRPAPEPVREPASPSAPSRSRRATGQARTRRGAGGLSPRTVPSRSSCPYRSSLPPRGPLIASPDSGIIAQEGSITTEGAAAPDGDAEPEDAFRGARGGHRADGG